MSLSPESSLTSSSSERKPPKRSNPTSSPSADSLTPAADPSPKKSKSEPNSPRQDSSSAEDGPLSDAQLARIGLTQADLLLTVRERARKSEEFYRANFKGYHIPIWHPGPNDPEPKDPLPEGWAWGAYDPTSGNKEFPYRIVCLNCGAHGKHKSDDCKDIDKKEAVEFRKAAGLFSTREIQQRKNK